jgi:hypothetical protein
MIGAGRSAGPHHGPRCFRKGTVLCRPCRAAADASTVLASNPPARQSMPSGQCPALLGCRRAAAASRPLAALADRYTPRGRPPGEGPPPPGVTGPSPRPPTSRQRSSPKKRQLHHAKIDLTA